MAPMGITLGTPGLLKLVALTKCHIMNKNGVILLQTVYHQKEDKKKKGKGQANAWTSGTLSAVIKLNYR